MLWGLAAAEVRQRPGRALLTLLSIVLGVAAVVAVNLTASTTRRSYDEMFRKFNGRAALEVVARNGKHFNQSEVDGLESVSGVQAAVPSLQAFTVLRRSGTRVTLRLLGIDPARDRLVRDYEITDGVFLDDRPGVLMEEQYAAWAGIRVSDELPLLLTSRNRFGVEKVPVVGLLSPKGVAGFNQGSVLFFPLNLAQRWFARPGQIDTLSLVLSEGADEAAVRQAISERLPADLTVRPTATRAALGRDTFSNAERGLEFGCALMVALAIFVVLNTFQMNLSERRARLAILRAIGATQRQILRLLLLETLAMGVIGAVLGSLLGLGGAHLLLRAMAMLAVAAPLPIQLTWQPFALAIVIGASVAVVATYVPARRASRISPMEAMRAAAPQDQRAASRLTSLGGAVLFIASGLVVGACIRGWLPIAVSIPAGVVFLAAFAFVVPALVRPLGACIVKLISPVFHVEAYLAEQQLTHRSARAGLTAGVLYIAVAAGVGLGTTIINNVQDIRSWHRKTMQGDFFIRAAFADARTGAAVQMPMALADGLRRIEGVQSVDAIRYFAHRNEDENMHIITRDYAAVPELPLVLAEGQPDDVRRGLAAGEIVLGTVLAEQKHLHLGDQFVLHTPEGPQTRRIAGLAVDYMLGGNVVFLERSAAAELFQVEGADFFLVRARPAALATVRDQVTAFCEKEGLLLHSFAELSQLLDNIMSGILSGLWGLLALGFVVAGFGIGNTLMMNVLEQTREIALLRVVGMTQWQVRRMILTQAFIIGVVGLSLGTFAGVNTAYIITLCMKPLLGYTIAFSLPPSLIIGSFAIALGVALLAAWFPAGRAAKMNLLLALQYE